MPQTLQIHSRVGKDGVLTLCVPLGIADADMDVVVTIQPIDKSSAAHICGPENWHEFVARTYGSCAGLGLQRHEQGLLEAREAIE